MCLGPLSADATPAGGDVFTPEGAFAYLEAKGASAQPQRAVQQLCKAAEEEYGSLDNITAVLVQI